MIRINNSTVHLTAAEMVVTERFDEYLDNGMGIPSATIKALNEFNVPWKIEHRIGSAFVSYLSEGTVTLDTWLNAVPAERAVAS